MDSVYQLVFDSKVLRYLLYPLWNMNGKINFLIAYFLLLIATLLLALAVYRLSGKLVFIRQLGKLKTTVSAILAVLGGAIFFMLFDWLPATGGHINHPKDILIMAVFFWPVVLFLGISALISYNRKHIIISKGKEYKDYFVRGTRLVSEHEFNRAIEKAYKYADNDEKAKIQLGKVVIPPSVESYHISVAGTTGSGKSQTMFQIFKVIEAREENAIVFDIGGDFAKRYKRPQDKIFNPFDSKSVRWNPLKEIREKRDCATLAEAITAVNESDVSGKRWADYSKAFLTAILEFMFESGMSSVERFLYYAFEADQTILTDVLAGSTAAAYVQEGNEEVFQSIRTTAVSKLEAWKYLIHDDKSVPDFSVRDWIRQQPAESIYLTVKDSELSALRDMVSCFYALAFQEALDVPKFNKRLWYFLDEVDSLGYIVSLRHGLTKLRKHNATIVLGFQAISQLRATYGQQITDTLHVNTRVQISMAVTGDTAKYFSDVFGSQEINRRQQNYSENSSGMFSGGNSSSTVANNVQRITGKTLLESEFSSLPNLTGYVRLIGLPEITKFTVPFSG